jgi:hypothetical protein
MKDRLGIEVSKLQIKNKWDKLKEDFKAWKKLLLRQTGTGWCPTKGTIVMDDEWWKKARAVSVELLLTCCIFVFISGVFMWFLHLSGHSRLWKIQETRTPK